MSTPEAFEFLRLLIMCNWCWGEGFCSALHSLLGCTEKVLSPHWHVLSYSLDFINVVIILKLCHSQWGKSPALHPVTAG